MLSQKDLKVLKAISEGESGPKSIAEKLQMKIEAVRASADALGEEGLISVEKPIEELVSLTEEGRRYAMEGLPERALLSFIGPGKAVSELKDPVHKIGLGWLRKKGWAVIDKGMIRPIGSAPKGKDEEMLDLLLMGPKNKSSLKSNLVTDLRNRGLVKLEKSKSWFYEISDAGRSKIIEIGKLPVITGSAIIDFTPLTLVATGEIGNRVSDNLSLREFQDIGDITSDMIRSGHWSEENGFLFCEYKGELLRVRPYDPTLAADRIYPGKRHPYQRLIDFMREIMLEMGFVEIKGQIVQSSFWNFDALFQPQDHPAREMQDTFYLDSRAEIPDYTRVKEMHECGRGAESTGWGGVWRPEVACQEVLRTHTTGVTIKYLADHPEPPVKAFGIDRVYRREAIDATHTPEFEQLEGIVMDRDVTFCHLLGILKEFYAKMGFEEVRFRPGYFPYTEPSVEPEVFIDGLGWVELGGAGVFRKEVTAPFGIEHPVLAWGLGVSRVAMLRLGLKDLRLLYQSDLEWLRATPVSIKL